MLILLLLIAQNLSPDSILANIDARLAKIKTIRGEIRRELTLGQSGRLEMIGKFYTVIPSKLRVDFALPEEQQLITNGRTLWTYTPAKNELITRDISAAQPNEKQGMGAMIDFGGTVTDLLTKGYDLKVDYTWKVLKYNMWILKGLARDTMARVAKVLIWVDRDNFLIRRFETYGRKNKLTSIYVVEKDRSFEESTVIPTQFEMRIGTTEGLMKIRNYLSLLELNVELSDSIFTPPKWPSK